MQNIVALFMVVFWSVMLVQDIVDYMWDKLHVRSREYSLFRFFTTILISFMLAFYIGDLVGWI